MPVITTRKALVPRDGAMIPYYHLCIPERLFTLELPHTALRLYLYLKRLEAEQGGGRINVRLQLLAKACRMSISSASNGLEKLAEARLIRILEISDKFHQYEVLE